MRTREQLQGWIRQGMPLPVEAEEPKALGALCDLFYLTMNPEPGRLQAQCWQCEIKFHCGAIKADGSWTGGVADACQSVCSWMLEHSKRSGLSHLDALQAFHNLDWMRVANWIKSAMRGDGGGPHSGLMMPEGIDRDLERGIWLVDGRMPVGP